MADYSLGVARGRIVIDPTGAIAGAEAAAAASGSMRRQNLILASSLGVVGRSMTVMGIAALAGFGVAVNAASKFEKQMSEFKAVSSATEEQMGRVADVAMRIGRETSLSTSEAAAGMIELSKAGISTEDILNGAADATAALAEAGGVDLEVAASTAAAAMNTFKIGAEDLEGVADSFAGTANRTATDVGELALALQYTGSSASLLGIPLEDVNVALGLLANRGQRGSKAGTTLNRMLINLNPSSGAAAQAMRDLGIITEDGSNQFYDAAGNMKSLSDVAEILQTSTEGLSQEQKIMKLETIFGSRALAAATTLAEAGAEGFDGLAASIGEVSAADVAAERLDNMSGSIEILKGSMETLLIVAGTPFLAPFKKVVDMAVVFVNWLSSMDESTFKLMGTITLVVGSLLLLGGAVALVASAWVRFKVAMEAIQIGSLLTNPVGIAIVAILALAAGFYYLYQNSETFRKAVQPALDAIKGYIERAVDAVQKLVGFFRDGSITAEKFGRKMDVLAGGTGATVGVFKSVYEAVSTAFNWIKDTAIPAALDFVDAIGGWGNVLKIVLVAISPVGAAIGGLIYWLISMYQHNETFRSSIQSVWEWIQGNVFPIIGSFIDLLASWGDFAVRMAKFYIDAWNTLWPVTSYVLGVIGDRIESWVGLIVELWNRFGDNILDSITNAWNLVRRAVTNGLQFIRGVITVFSGLLSGDWSKVWDGIKMIVGAAFDQVKNIIGFALASVGLLIRTAMDIVAAVWTGAWNVIKNIVTTVIGTAIDIIKGLIDFVLVGIPNMITSILNWFAQLVANAPALWASFTDQIKRLVSVAVAFIINKWRQWSASLQALWSRTWSNVMTRLSSAWASIKTAVVNGILTVVNFLRNLPSRAANAVASLVNRMRSKGSEAMASMRGAVSAGIALLLTIVRGIPDRVKSAIGNLGSILLTAGKQIISGLIDGIQAQMGPLGTVLGGVGGFIAANKGPEEYDRKLLIPAGRLIMMGLQEGLDSEFRNLMRQVDQMAPTIQASMTLAPTAPAAMVGSGGSTVYDQRTESTTFKVEAKTDADPKEIMDEFHWMSAVKVVRR